MNGGRSIDGPGLKYSQKLPSCGRRRTDLTFDGPAMGLEGEAGPQEEALRHSRPPLQPLERLGIACLCARARICVRACVRARARLMLSASCQRRPVGGWMNLTLPNLIGLPVHTCKLHASYDPCCVQACHDKGQLFCDKMLPCGHPCAGTDCVGRGSVHVLVGSFEHRSQTPPHPKQMADEAYFASGRSPECEPAPQPHYRRDAGEVLMHTACVASIPRHHMRPSLGPWSSTPALVPVHTVGGGPCTRNGTLPSNSPASHGKHQAKQRARRRLKVASLSPHH